MASKIDVYFLADTTFSMSSVIQALQNGSEQIVDDVMAEWPNVDLAFGVGSYRDFGAYAAFDHQLAPTADAGAVRQAIDGWSAEGGDDVAEAQFYALDRLAADRDPAGGTIGWRAGAKRVVVWFGDAPGHDPICAAISGLSYDIDEGRVISALRDADITVVAVSAGQSALTSNQADVALNVTGDWLYLDHDPRPYSEQYQGICPIDGAGGQATRITAATGGTHLPGISADTIVSTIRGIVTGQIATISQLSLQATGAIASLVTSISPAYYGPLHGTEARDLSYSVHFEGLRPCTREVQTLTGGLAVMADAAEVDRVAVTVQVPICGQAPPIEEIPEPSTWLLLASGMALVAALGRRLRPMR
jgi:hypothetical protein